MPSDEVNLNDISSALKRRIKSFEEAVKSGKITTANFDARRLFTSFRATLPKGGGVVTGSPLFDSKIAGANIACDEGCG